MKRFDLFRYSYLVPALAAASLLVLSQNALTHEFAQKIPDPDRVDLGRLYGGSQWELFQSDMQRIADVVAGWRSDAQYDLFLEFLFPVSDQRVFGIQCYILDGQGRNVFSFLLNTHHSLFFDARLVAENTSEAARTRLMEKATVIGLTALEAQLNKAREQPE